MRNNEVFVYISLEGKDILFGKLWFHNRKGRESASLPLVIPRLTAGAECLCLAANQNVH
jgi:hypothetical protein